MYIEYVHKNHSASQQQLQIFIITLRQAKKSSILLFALLVVVCIGLSSHLWHGDVLFHTDVARDFLVLDDIVQTRKMTLIGPHAGGIPGVFHGPLWYYISLAPFILTHGNPVFMGWFWWLCAMLATAVFFITSRSISRHTLSNLLATLCFTLLLTPSSTSAVNNYLADLFGFLVFFIWWRWWQKPSFLTAALGWLSLGILVQFQMAFAIPIALVWMPFFAFRVVKNKAWKHLLAPLFFLPPLASFVLFEVRHDWLQVKSVITYIQQSSSDLTFIERALSRLTSATRDGVNVFRLPGFLNAAVVLLMGSLGWRSGKAKDRSYILLFLLWYVGWWTIVLVFSGTVWGYYYSPFFGIVLLGLGLFASHSAVARGVLALATLLLLFQSRSTLLYESGRFNSSSWKLLHQIAADALSQPDRGYFLYSQDQYAYSLKYAFAWQEKKQPEIAAFAFTKKPHTVLVKTADNPENPFLTSTMWQEQKITILQPPDSVTKYPFGFQLEHYTLSDEAMAVPIDPNLILDLHFR